MKKAKLSIQDIQNSSIEIIKEIAKKEVKGGGDDGIIIVIDDITT